MKPVFKLTMIIATLIVVGCQPESQTAESSINKPGVNSNDSSYVEHSHDAPHGGAVADWGGGKFHVEFVVDHDKQEATVYVLGSDCKTQVAINAKKINLAIDDPSFQIELAAKPQNGETEGVSARFVGYHENLGIVQEFTGRIFGSFDGKAYNGKFAEDAHDH